jgi:hypothetical protein
MAAPVTGFPKDLGLLLAHVLVFARTSPQEKVEAHTLSHTHTLSIALSSLCPSREPHFGIYAHAQ